MKIRNVPLTEANAFPISSPELPVTPRLTGEQRQHTIMQSMQLHMVLRHLPAVHNICGSSRGRNHTISMEHIQCYGCGVNFACRSGYRYECHTQNAICATDGGGETGDAVGTRTSMTTRGQATVHLTAVEGVVLLGQGRMPLLGGGKRDTGSQNHDQSHAKRTGLRSSSAAAAR